MGLHFAAAPRATSSSLDQTLRVFSRRPPRKDFVQSSSDSVLQMEKEVVQVETDGRILHVLDMGSES